MSSLPRIVRAMPNGPITRPERAIPVHATIRWHMGKQIEIPAIAIAWTRDAVEVEWEMTGVARRSDWIPAHDVRRAR
jgi:hypothetical protein